MSLSTLTSIATQRDTGTPQSTEKKRPARGSLEKTEERGYLSSLAAAIPTEPLALYTFLVATIVATLHTDGDKRLFMRWTIYAAMMVVIVLWLGASYIRNGGSDRKRHFPWLETASAVAAFAAWGLAMPESPLNAVLSGDNRTIWTAIITVAGVVILGLLGKPLKEEVKRTRRPRKRGANPAQPAAPKPGHRLGDDGPKGQVPQARK